MHSTKITTEKWAARKIHLSKLQETGKRGVLQSVGSQTVGCNLATEHQEKKIDKIMKWYWDINRRESLVNI